jgi:hypothetical protein
MIGRTSQPSTTSFATNARRVCHLLASAPIIIADLVKYMCGHYSIASIYRAYSSIICMKCYNRSHTVSMVMSTRHQQFSGG